jgi:hypothetical protein
VTAAERVGPPTRVSRPIAYIAATGPESVHTCEGTHDMHLLIVAEEIAGIPAFR